VIVSVSQVRDTLENIRLFVEGNLSGGIDHMVVLLDEPEPEVEEYLAGIPEVTHLVTDGNWWGAERPENMSHRLLLNWNTVSVLLTPFEDVEWLFHMDGDEIYRLDKDDLRQIPADHAGVIATNHEVVHRREWDGDPNWYKRPLNQNELSLLWLLGELKEPTPTEYFRGHSGNMFEGKPGIRPGFEVGFHWHQPMPLQEGLDVKIAGLESQVLLHLESPRLSDFLDRWHYHFVGNRIYGKPLRVGTQNAAQALEDLGTPAEIRDEVLTEIFERTVPENLELLQKLGFAVEFDPRNGGQEPERELSAEFGEAFAAVLAATKEMSCERLHFDKDASIRMQAVKDVFARAGL